MSTHARATYEWTIEATPVGGVGSTIEFGPGMVDPCRPSRFRLEQKDDVAAARLEIIFPSATKFMDAWSLINPLGVGAKVVLKVDGFTRFTGWVFEHIIDYANEIRGVTIVCYDRMGMLKDAVVDLDMTRHAIRPDRFNLTRNAVDDHMFEAITADLTPLYLRPWKSEYIVSVWLLLAGKYKRVVFSEYQTMYDIGAIYFRNDTIKCIGEDATETHALDDVEDDVYASFVYFDAADTSTTISNVIRGAFETPAAIGGLEWTEGVEYEVDDETPADILSGMKWNTNEGDGDAVSFISNLYDDPRIGLTPSYWIRDFNGDGKVTLRLVAQEADPADAIDIDLIMSARFPSPLGAIYTRAVLVNNEATRLCLTRDGATFSDTFPLAGYTETPPVEGEVDKHVGYLADDSCKTSWGYFKIGTKGQYAVDYDLPADTELFRKDLGAEKYIDLIHINSRWTFQDGEHLQPHLHDNATGKEAVNGIYTIVQNQRFTVEYNLETGATPDEAAWYPIHPDLFVAEVDPLDGNGSWLSVDGINIEARHLRMIVNNPLFATVGESNWDAKAYRMILFWFSEFQVFGGGRVQSGAGEVLPSVQFTDDPDDALRCMCNLAGDEVDMYRPTLLQITEALGLKWKTLVLESDDVWEFLHKDSGTGLTPGDCGDVSLGYKYLVTILDSYSKENEWEVRIDPRPDVTMGSTVKCTRLSTTKTFLVHGNVIEGNGPALSQSIILSDHETASGGEGDGCGP